MRSEACAEAHPDGLGMSCGWSSRAADRVVEIVVDVGIMSATRTTALQRQGELPRAAQDVPRPLECLAMPSRTSW